MARVEGSEPIESSEDVIDSRDVIARINYLESHDLECPDACNHSHDCGQDPECYHEGECIDEDEHYELDALRALADEAQSSPDWRYGETLIRDSYFEGYAQQFAEDIGAVANTNRWPLTCIDWKEAARELQQDYMSVDFDGVTYWIRG